MPGLEDRLGAGWLAPFVGAGLERHVEGRAGGVLAAVNGQSSIAARSACGPPSSAWKPSPITLAVAGEHRAHQRVGADLTATALGELKRPAKVSGFLFGVAVETSTS